MHRTCSREFERSRINYVRNASARVLIKYSIEPFFLPFEIARVHSDYCNHVVECNRNLVKKTAANFSNVADLKVYIHYGSLLIQPENRDILEWLRVGNGSKIPDTVSR